MSSDVCSLNLQRTFGFNYLLPNAVHNLSIGDEIIVAYTVSHNVVIHNITTNHQRILRGHRYTITAISSSLDRKFLATADTGPDPSLIVWDVTTASPLRTFFKPNLPTEGTCSLCFSLDSRVLASLSTSSPSQSIHLWDWTNPDPSCSVLCSTTLPSTSFPFIYLSFSPYDSSLLVSVSPSSVLACKVSQSSPNDANSTLTLNLTNCVIVPSIFKLPLSTSPFSSTPLFLPSNSPLGDFVVPTDDGRGVVFGANEGAIQSTRTVKLHESSGITDSAQTPSTFIITTKSGVVRIFDLSFRLLAWFDDLNVGPLLSLSTAPLIELEQFLEDPLLSVDVLKLSPFEFSRLLSSFVLSCETGLAVYVNSPKVFSQVDPSDRHGDVILEAFTSPVSSVASHLQFPLVFTGDYSGLIKIFNIESNEMVFKSQHSSAVVSLSLNSDLNLLLSSFGDGCIGLFKFDCDLMALERIGLWDFSSPPCNHITWSDCGGYFGTIDSDGVVSLFGQVDNQEDRIHYEQQSDWFLIGRHGVFTGTPKSLLFSTVGPTISLVAISDDKTIVEVDVIKSRDPSPVPLSLVLSARKIVEQLAKPQCLFNHTDESYLVFNDEFKIRMIDKQSFELKQTVLGPVFTSPVSQITPVKGFPEFLVFSTFDRIVGVLHLPLDGNPARVLGVLAHADSVLDVATIEVKNRSFVCSVGGPAELVTSSGQKQREVHDGSLCVWNFDPLPLKQQLVNSGQGIKPFLDALNCDESFIEFLHDVFTFSCIQSKTDKDMVVLPSSLPSMLSALDVFLSEWELGVLEKEADELAKGQKGLTFDDFVKIYFNHRRVIPIDDYLANCLPNLNRIMDTQEPPSRHEMAELVEDQNQSIQETSIDFLMNQIISRGESFESQEELEELLEGIINCELSELPDSLTIEDLMNLLQLSVD
ncbi:hypothetical protein P9112_006552 [Eukaryota sp. TZLM1-RC]